MDARVAKRSSALQAPAPRAARHARACRPPLPARPLSAARRPASRVVRASNVDLEEVDPMTGEVITGSVAASVAGNTVQAGGLNWAYRKADADPAAAAPGKLPVLCLHGIGSSSYAYRNTIRLLGEAGHDAYAVDWIGHGASDKPTSGFGYSADEFFKALGQFVDAVGIEKPYVLVVQGYILGQYGLLYALSREDEVARLVILNTPLGLKSKLRPELAAYKNPVSFLRPKPGSAFDGANFNAAGGPYAMQLRDVQAYAAPYEADPSASAAIYSIMEQVDFPALLRRVDEGYRTWRQPTLLIHGSADTFLDLSTVINWLEDKRTSMKLSSNIEAKLGHVPQEDYADAIHPAILEFVEAAE